METRISPTKRSIEYVVEHGLVPIDLIVVMAPNGYIRGEDVNIPLGIVPENAVAYIVGRLRGGREIMEGRVISFVPIQFYTKAS